MNNLRNRVIMQVAIGSGLAYIKKTEKTKL